MSDEPSHKAMLYFLEVLMNSNGPLTVSQLAGRFGSRSFSADMRTAAGGNESGLKKFLLKYPSLFTVRGNMVSLCDGKTQGDVDDDTSSTASSTSEHMRRPLPDVSAEMEAVQYFQKKLMKKEERWVPIRSIAGHLSQAALTVRTVVGPQLEFRDWLLKHPHIFEVQGELVGMRDGIAAVSTPAILPKRQSSVVVPTTPRTPQTAHARPTSFNFPPTPKTPPPTRRATPKTPPPIRRSQSFSEKRVMQLQAQQAQSQGQGQRMQDFIQPMRRRNTVSAPVSMTATEYKAVMFLKDIIETKGDLKLHSITGHFSQASEAIRNTIGWSKSQLEDFLQKNCNVFNLSEDEVVSVRKSAKLNVIITGSRPQGSATVVPTTPMAPSISMPATAPAGSRVLTGRKGKIFHVAKLWGIVDLGRHEHVFFDKSIMMRPIDDLQKQYKIGETLCFTAILAPPNSRAKWKATRVWKEQDPTPSESDFEFSYPNHAPSPSASIEEELNRFYPAPQPVDKFADAAQSLAGSVQVWNFQDNSDDSPNKENESAMATPTTVPENCYMAKTSLRGMSFSESNGVTAESRKASELNKMRNATSTVSPRGKKCVDASCQTVSTGGIIATQLYDQQ